MSSFHDRPDVELAIIQMARDEDGRVPRCNILAIVQRDQMFRLVT
jgi:hypothetical protein